jgi:hypothetical protein
LGFEVLLFEDQTESILFDGPDVNSSGVNRKALFVQAIQEELGINLVALLRFQFGHDVFSNFVPENHCTGFAVAVN